MQKVGELPAAPAVLATAINLSSDLDSNIRDLSNAISADQSLTARVLRVSNSPYYGRAKRVGSIADAILVLGFETVREIVVTASVADVFRSREAREHGHRLWQHSLATGVCAREVCRALALSDKGQVFVAGLMHDIGKLVLMLKLPEWYVKMIAKIEVTGDEFWRVERRVLRFDHTHVAAVLLSDWSFPAKLISPISRHHTPPPLPRGGKLEPVHVVALANSITKFMGVGFRQEPDGDLAAQPIARSLGLRKDQLQIIMEQSKQRFDAEAGLYTH